MGGDGGGAKAICSVRTIVSLRKSFYKFPTKGMHTFGN